MRSGAEHRSGQPGDLIREKLAETHVRFPPSLESTLQEEWLFLATCGTWFSGQQRVGIAAAARAAQLTGATSGNEAVALPGDDLTAVAIEAAGRVALTSVAISDGDIERWEASGLNRFELVEIVGVVARLQAVDTLFHLSGASVVELPDPIGGSPKRKAPRKAKQRASRLPTVNAGVKGALSGVPSESDAWLRLQSVLFDVEDTSALPGLTQVQAELLATRTSIVNHCVY